MQDLSGQQFGFWTVIKFYNRNGKKYYWECRCICGIIKIIWNCSLKNGQSKSCGCIRKLQLTGKRFSYLLVTNFAGIKKPGITLWNCLCSCGNTKIISGVRLVSGKTKSCGCYNSKCASLRATTHGMSDTRIYGIWSGMVKRCTNPNSHAFKDYGGRGIVVCKDWLTFEGFYRDVGKSYEEHVREFGEKDTTADRFPDPNGNYEINNFKWSTRLEQGRTKRCSSNTQNLDLHMWYRKTFQCYLTHCIRQGNDTLLFKERFGCTLLEFKKYIESQFEPWMNWSNHGNYTKKIPNVWNFDHINPCYMFDLSKEKDRSVCFNYKNLRPFPAQKNKSEIIRKLVTI